MRASATTAAQPKLVGQAQVETNFVAIDEKEAARSFAAAVVDFDAYTLARAARRDVETARVWKAAKRCPNGTSLINMASLIPAVRDWLEGEIESRMPHPPLDARAATAALAMLQQQAMEPGERGAMARAMLTDLAKGGA